MEIKYVSASDPEVWSKMRYRPILDSEEINVIIENPDFRYAEEPILTNRILYTATTQPTSTWIDENCSENIFDENTGEGYLVLKDSVSELTGGVAQDWSTIYTIFSDVNWISTENILSVTIPTQITSIGDYAFYCYTNLEYIEIPNNVTSIGNSAFYSCSSLTSINIPNNVTSIGNSAFETCTELASIELPSELTEIGNRTFSNCSNLTSIKVDSNNTIYDSRNNCNAIIETETNTLIQGCQNTVIPENVTSIGYAAFYKCSNLTSIEIPNSITSIGSIAFAYCSSLTSIVLPSSLTSIVNGAFYECSSLTSVICEAITPPTLGTTNVFANIPNDAILHVPAGSVEAYTSSDWNTYFSGRIQAIA